MDFLTFGNELTGTRFSLYIVQTLEIPECTVRGWDAAICWYCSSMKSYLMFRRLGGIICIRPMDCLSSCNRCNGPKFGVYIWQTMGTQKCTTRCWDAAICWYCRSMKSYLTFRRFGGD